MAWVPAERVLFAGDLVFAGLTPLVFMGSLTGALAALDWLAGFEPQVVVPGHGGVARRRGDRARARGASPLLPVRARVAEKGMATGLTPLAAARDADLGEFSDWPDAERIVLNLHRAYADARRQRAGRGSGLRRRGRLARPTHAHVGLKARGAECGSSPTSEDDDDRVGVVADELVHALPSGVTLLDLLRSDEGLREAGSHALSHTERRPALRRRAAAGADARSAHDPGLHDVRATRRGRRPPGR